MSNIVLRNLEKPTATKEAVEAGYLYKDVAFDLDPTFTSSGEFQKKSDQKDLKPLYNKNAVLTSLRNIFTTTPGEKLLNPRFGIDLRSFLFDPVSETRAFVIGNIINFQLSIPTLNLYGISLAGVLNNDGFTITNGN